jgi:CO dehydrogenase/acetyl-CoA synthase gamma subunit (corrinoid Fe-S protein)
MNKQLNVNYTALYNKNVAMLGDIMVIQSVSQWVVLPTIVVVGLFNYAGG